jgi:hypothetical protein
MSITIEISETISEDLPTVIDNGGFMTLARAEDHYIAIQCLPMKKKAKKRKNNEPEEEDDEPEEDEEQDVVGRVSWKTGKVENGILHFKAIKSWKDMIKDEQYEWYIEPPTEDEVNACAKEISTKSDSGKCYDLRFMEVWKQKIEKAYWKRTGGHHSWFYKEPKVSKGKPKSGLTPKPEKKVSKGKRGNQKKVRGIFRVETKCLQLD